jgi:uncharacterized protein YraI
MRRRPLMYSLGALLLTSLGLASAQNAYTARPMNVRAGPNRDYPLVAQLDSGAPLDVHGCLDDWSWCDVSFEDNRGWIYAGGVSFAYQGGRVPLYSYGPKLGLPIVAFSLMTYWGDYYRGRSWYAQRDTWSHRTLPPHMRPAGRSHAGTPHVSAGRPSMSHGRPPAGGSAPSRGEERGHAAPSGGRQHAGAPSTSHGRPPGSSGSETRTSPQPRNGAAPGGHPEPRAEQHGHSASPARGAQQNRKPQSRPPDHPPQ